jgi:transcriptional regulator with XRE-family HTH domain
MSHPAVAKKLDDIVSPKTLWGYVNGIAFPAPDVLLKITEKFDVSLDWLLTGKEKPPQEPPRQGVAYDAAGLRAVVEAVEEGLVEEKLKLRPAQKAELVSLLYEDAMEEGSATEEIRVRLHRLVRLYAAT